MNTVHSLRAIIITIMSAAGQLLCMQDDCRLVYQKLSSMEVNTYDFTHPTAKIQSIDQLSNAEITIAAFALVNDEKSKFVQIPIALNMPASNEQIYGLIRLPPLFTLTNTTVEQSLDGEEFLIKKSDAPYMRISGKKLVNDFL